MNHAPIDPAKLKRQKRLEETLRENLKRRKEQARGRTEAPADTDEASDTDTDE
ncbi:hypothetical protein [Aureimonas sp. ME7]|uniref:hypothetical protein n=1 Tax=Aureimonas sp. ME7 TaxID=2744252 RepID=UPI0015F4782B|nr:hypothetical protein [Aureimonas sp. ME7]